MSLFTITASSSPKQIAIELGKAVRAARFAKNDMSQEELAQRVGCTRQTIGGMESGNTCPSFALAARIFLELNVSISLIPTPAAQ